MLAAALGARPSHRAARRLRKALHCSPEFVYSAHRLPSGRALAAERNKEFLRPRVTTRLTATTTCASSARVAVRLSARRCPAAPEEKSCCSDRSRWPRSQVPKELLHADSADCRPAASTPS